MKKCPRCKTPNGGLALKCKYCGDALLSAPVIGVLVFTVLFLIGVALITMFSK